MRHRALEFDRGLGLIELKGNVAIYFMPWAVYFFSNNAAAVTLEVNGESWCCLCESEEQQTDQVGVDYILITS